MAKTGQDEINRIVKNDKGTKDRRALTEYYYDIENDEQRFINTNCVPVNVIYSGRYNGGIPVGKYQK